MSRPERGPTPAEQLAAIRRIFAVGQFLPMRLKTATPWIGTQPPAPTTGAVSENASRD